MLDPLELGLQSALSHSVLVLGTELGSSARACSLNCSANLSSALLRYFSSYVIKYFSLQLQLVCMCPGLILLSEKHRFPKMSSGKFPSGILLENVYYVFGLQLPRLFNLFYVLLWESQMPPIPIQLLSLKNHFVSRYFNTLPPLNLNN